MSRGKGTYRQLIARLALTGRQPGRGMAARSLGVTPRDQAQVAFSGEQKGAGAIPPQAALSFSLP